MVFKLFKRKCKRNLKLETTPFQRKVLLTLQNLQGNKKYHTGVTVKDMESYIVQNYKVDGDTGTQIQIALDQLVTYGTVKTNGYLYKLIGHFANVAVIPKLCKERFKAMSRLESIYPTVWDYCSRSAQSCKCMCLQDTLCSRCNKYERNPDPDGCQCESKNTKQSNCKNSYTPVNPICSCNKTKKKRNISETSVGAPYKNDRKRRKKNYCPCEEEESNFFTQNSCKKRQRRSLRKRKENCAKLRCSLKNCDKHKKYFSNK